MRKTLPTVYSALLGSTRLLISEKFVTYTINWSYTIIWQVRVIDSSISDNVKATVASITDTHDKDIEEVTETLCDVATRLNSIQNGVYWLQLVKSDYSKTILL